LGPVDFFALLRFALIWACVAIKILLSWF
jgi:hypothetical protein